MLDDAADVVQGEVRQSCIAVASEQVFTVFPDRLVNVHAGAVVANDRLGHEGGGFAVRVRHIVDHVFLQLNPVSTLDQGAELGAQFHLTGVGHFVVMHFDGDAQGLKDQAHLRAHVLEAVNRRHGEIAALDSGTVAGVAMLVFFASVPGGFFRADLDETAGHVVLPAYAVENEEFWLRTKVGGVTKA